MSHTHKWEIVITAGSYFQDLAQNFCGNDIRLYCENGEDGMHFSGYSQHIDTLDDPRHVAQRLYSLNLILNGAHRVYRKGAPEPPIEFVGFMHCISGNIYDRIALETIEELPFNINSTINNNRSEWNKPKECSTSHLVYLAKIDPDLRTILFLVGLISSNSPIECILTWGTLYKVLDTVKHLSKSISLEIDNFADKSRINEFTSACNNMSILGIYARHGKTANSAPKKVITDLKEAINLIISLARNFCDAYVRVKHP